MKYLKFCLIVIAVVLASISTLFAASDSSILDSIAVITDYSGKCSVKAMSAAKKKSAAINMPVYEGDEYSTGKGSYLEITFDDATIVRLDENATMLISNLKRENNTAKTIFNLTMGKIFAIVDKLKSPKDTFEVHTKMAIAAVKGTELGISADDTASSLAVFEGLVAYMDLTGQNSVDVPGGNESTTGSDGKPGAPGGFKNFSGYGGLMSGLKGQLDLIKQLKKEGKLKDYLEQKNKEKGVSGGTQTEVNIGNAGNSGGVEALIKQQLKDELNGAKQHAFDDLKFINEQMQADFHLGKTMLDVHGNRVRIEEYVFTPKEELLIGYSANGPGTAQSINREIDQISLTFRDNRLDYLKIKNVFAADVFLHRTDTMWDSVFYGISDFPENFLVNKNITFSNTVDDLTLNTDYMMMYGSSWSGSQSASSMVNVKQNETLSINGCIKEEYEFNYTDYGYPSYGYYMIKTANDKTSHADPDHPYTEQSYTYGDGTYIKSMNKSYNDASTLNINYYLINDNGVSLVNDNNSFDIYSLALTGNLEMQISSSDFRNGDIDIVSKTLITNGDTLLDPYNYGSIYGINDYGYAP